MMITTSYNLMLRVNFYQQFVKFQNLRLNEEIELQWIRAGWNGEVGRAALQRGRFTAGPMTRLKPDHYSRSSRCETYTLHFIIYNWLRTVSQEFSMHSGLKGELPSMDSFAKIYIDSEKL